MLVRQDRALTVAKPGQPRKAAVTSVRRCCANQTSAICTSQRPQSIRDRATVQCWTRNHKGLSDLWQPHNKDHLRFLHIALWEVKRHLLSILETARVSHCEASEQRFSSCCSFLNCFHFGLPEHFSIIKMMIIYMARAHCFPTSTGSGSRQCTF